MGSANSTENHFPKRADGKDGRECTDQCCGIFFIVCMALMVAMVGLSFFEGNTQRLTHGFDYGGHLCGIDPEVAGKPFLYYCGSEERVGDFPKKLDFQSKSCVQTCPNGTNLPIACLMRNFHNFTELPGATQNNVTFVSTLNVEVTQSVTLQNSYPTEVFGGRYCVPQWSSSNSLRAEVIDGPLRRVSRVTTAVGSFRHAWPVILGVALLSVVLGLVYLYVLRNFAGLLIFGSLCASTGLLLIMGLFFLLGLFGDPFGTNPIYRSFYGGEARAYSLIVGLILSSLGVCMYFTTMHSMEKIDESIGIIVAACDCIFAPGAGKFDLLSQPIIEGLTVAVLIVAIFWGMMLIISVGGFESKDISVNAHPFEGLEKHFRLPWWGKPALCFYVFCAIWLLEVAIALGHFVVSYCVCLWYFVEIEEESDDEELTTPFQQAYQGKGLKHVQGIRVAGVDKVAGERHGFIEKGKAGKVLVVPIGKAGPGGNDFIPQDDKVAKKEMECGAAVRGLSVAIFFHLGSLAMGAFLVTLTRPFRVISQTIKAFMGKADKRASFDEEDTSPAGVVMAGCGLLSGLLEQIFGGFSKNAYVDIVLSSSDFNQAARDAFDFISEAGGVVAFLHGSTALYEMIGVICITAICGGLSFLLLTQISLFNEPEGSWYVSDPAAMTMVASGISAVISFGFMSLFNVTADTLLYVFAWSRHHMGSREELEKYCPYSLKYLVEDEMDAGPAAALVPAGKRNKMTRFAHATQKYAGTVLSTVRGNPGGRIAGTAEQESLLPVGT